MSQSYPNSFKLEEGKDARNEVMDKIAVKITN